MVVFNIPLQELIRSNWILKWVGQHKFRVVGEEGNDGKMNLEFFTMSTKVGVEGSFGGIAFGG